MKADVSVERLQISETMRAVNSALVDADSRDAVEAAVCRTLAESELYVFAWVGEYHPDSDTVRPTTAAGVEDGYLDEIAISVHQEPTSRGPTATAVRTNEVQVVRNILEDPEYEPWRDQAQARGYRSSVAVPLGTDDEPDCVLNIYTDRPQGFETEEREMFVELGETVETAIEGIEAQNELQETKAQYEMLTERISDAYYAVDEDWQIAYWNEQMATRTGVPESEVLGDSLWDAFPELEDTENEKHYRQAMTTGESVSFESYLGEPFEYWVSVDVYPDDGGLSVFSREITERKEYEQRIEAIIENTTNAIYIKDLDGEYQLLNDAAARLFGMEPEQAVGRTDEELFDEESVAEIREIDRQIVASGESDTRETVRYIDGREHVFIDNKFPYRDGSGDVVGIIGISHDITGRKARERDLRMTKRRLDLALEGTDTGVWERGLETSQTVWNDSMERLFGLEPGSFEGTDEAFREYVHPDDIERIEQARKRARKNDEQYEAEYRIQRADGEQRWVRARAQVIESEDGSRQMVGILTDITERRKREERLREQNEKLEVLNRIVRHDIRNDMQIILTLNEMLASRTEGELSEFADRAITHTDHAIALTQTARDLMETVLQDDTSREPTPLARTLENQLQDTRDSRDGVIVRSTTPIPRVQVLADEMLSSVFRNALKNAVQHVDRDLVEIDVAVTETDGHVTVRIADNGPGIPEDRREEVFGKGEKGLESDGTGIGLYLVHSLVENYGGDVWVEDTEAESGAVIKIRLKKAA
jgi:PAS domain S-box-containing protein